MAKGQKYHCGPKHAPQWLRKIFSIKFNASCRLHDHHYSVKTKYSRRSADKIFLDNMLKQAEGRRFWIIVAYFFHFSVKIFGRLNYKGSDQDKLR